MLKKYKIKERLTRAFIIIAVIASMAGVAGCIAMNYIAGQYDYALQNYGFSQGDIGQAMVNFADARSATRAIISYTDTDIIQSEVENHDAAKAACQEYMEKVSLTCTSDEEIAEYQNAESAMEKYWNLDTEIITLGNTLDVEKSAQAQARADEELNVVYENAYTALSNLMSVNVSTGNELQASLSVLRIVLFIVIVAVIVTALFISVLMGNNIAKGIAVPVGKLADRLKTFAQGQLSEEFPTADSKDEVADMIVIAKDMAENLATIIEDAQFRLEKMAEGDYTASSRVPEKYVGEFTTLHTSIHDVNERMNVTLKQIGEASDQVSAGSTNLADAAQSLAEGATEQASTVEELVATISSLTEDITQSAESAQASYENARGYAEKANKSKEEMQGMVRTMQEISETSKKIAGIIGGIEDIASQTNLLSLNASIEAARAGEAGRGFAVVADQIGKLAEESAHSAQNTRDLIMNALDEIEQGGKVAERTAESIDEVVEGINKVAEDAKTSSEASHVQSHTMKQADEGLNQISEIVQANSATAEETSATSEELSAQAVTLDDLLKQFKLKK